MLVDRVRELEQHLRALPRRGLEPLGQRVLGCLDGAVETARELGVEEQAIPLSAEEVAERCRSPRFRHGVFFPDGATVQPARLTRALRRACIADGVSLHGALDSMANQRWPMRIPTSRGSAATARTGSAASRPSAAASSTARVAARTTAPPSPLIGSGTRRGTFRVTSGRAVHSSSARSAREARICPPSQLGPAPCPE
ncbi:MAG: FAD-binding oxidoreductase [Actinobacteria bacterium]|nr:MAG: FAD-binding oxidoreductase [Actinomycetota bacterium]